MLKYIILILIILIFNNPSFSKGGHGEYLLIGNAYDKNNKAIRNGALYVEFKGKIDTIQTNDCGEYNVSIPWQTVCPSDFFIFSEIENRKLNPKSIYVTFRDDKIEIENKWKENTDKSTPIKMDLKFEDPSVNYSILIYIGLVLGIAGLLFIIFKRKIIL